VTVANNVLTHGVGGINIDGCRVGNTVETWPTTRSFRGGISSGYTEHLYKGLTQATGEIPAGRFPANFIHDGSDEVLQLFPDSKNVSKGIRGRGSDIYAGGKGFANTLAEVGQEIGYGDSGSAARFFYCAKASKKDRNEGLGQFEAKRDADRIKDDGTGGDNPRNRSNTAKLNHHPTVKPTDLMRYLCRLITPPNGTVLDPFTGSGSTGKAATLEGFNFIGIEQSAEYIAIAKARIESVTK
jgi:site-specific DNA-methyltransferase (adenine-specific)